MPQREDDNKDMQPSPNMHFVIRFSNHKYSNEFSFSSALPCETHEDYLSIRDAVEHGASAICKYFYDTYLERGIENDGSASCDCPKCRAIATQGRAPLVEFMAKRAAKPT